MAFVNLTKEENPKLGVSIDNALNYKDKDGKLAHAQKSTVLINAIKEAGQVAAMDQGTVTFNVSINGKYETYFVDNYEKEGKQSVVLRNAEDPYNKDQTIYLNKFQQHEKTMYSINQETNAGKKALENVDLKEVKNEDGTTSQYIKASVRLKNDKLKDTLLKKGKDHTAILSKNGYKIVAAIDQKIAKQEKAILNKEKQNITTPKKNQSGAKKQSKGMAM